MISEEPLLKTSVRQDTEYFVEDPFVSFSQSLREEGQSPNFIASIQIKCSGHGYFPEYQERAKRNLKQYVRQCLSSTPNLHTFKLTLNGFNIEDEDGYLASLLVPLKEQLNKSKCTIKTVWIHTNNLASYSLDDFKAMAQLIAVAGRQTNREELSIQMSNWQFSSNITFREMIGTLEEELSLALKFRVLRLQISSWFLNIEQAFHFIRQTLTTDQMLAKLNYNGESMDDAKLYIESVRRQTYDQFSKGRSEIAEKIKKNTGRNIPTQFLYYNVKHLQETMVNLVKGMLTILESIEDLVIDFRHWHPIFKLQDIRAQLQSKVGTRREFSFCQKASMASQIRKRQAERADQPLRTTYLL